MRKRLYFYPLVACPIFDNNSIPSDYFIILLVYGKSFLHFSILAQVRLFKGSKNFK